MLRRMFYPLIGLFIIACFFFGDEMWQFITGDPIRNIQDAAEGIKKGFYRFLGN